MDELSRAIDGLYSTFGGAKPKVIEGCPCCTDKNKLCLLLSRELKSLSAKDLGDYAFSVFLTAGGQEDFRYLLPRIFELAATHREWWPDVEVVLGKLKLARWQEWPANDRGVVRHFLRAWFDAVAATGTPELHHPKTDCLICGLALAGENLDPYFESLLDHPAALRLLHDWNSNRLFAKRKLANHFWNGNTSAAAPVIAFLTSSRVQDCLKTA